MTVFVVMERRGREARLVGVYATEEIAQEVTGEGGEWVTEVIPCDVLDQAP